MGGWLFNPEVVGPFAQPSLNIIILIKIKDYLLYSSFIFYYE